MDSNALSLTFILLVISCLISSCEQKPKSPAPPAISADGVEINYQVHGTGTPSLVFVHGWSGDQSYWKNQVTYFSKNFKVVTIDLAGHGKSGLDRKNWTMTDFGNDVVAVIEELDLDQVILVGHSMGSAAIVEAAQKIPGRVIGLIGVDTFRELGNARNPEEADQMLEPFREDFIGTTRKLVQENMFSEAPDSVVAHVASDMAQAPPEVAIPSAYHLILWDASKELPNVKVPIKLIDTDLPSTNLEIAKNYGLEVLAMSNVGHFPMIEDPETFNTLLKRLVFGLASKNF